MNKTQPAFPVSKEMCEHSKIEGYPFGLTKEEYAAIHLNTVPDASWMKWWQDEYIKSLPAAPETVAQKFAESKTKEGQAYTGFIKDHFDSNTGVWVRADDVPREVVDDVNSHVAVINKYYDKIEDMKAYSFLEMEIAWRRKIAAQLMNSFDNK